MKHAMALALLVAGCTQPGTAVLLTVDGSLMTQPDLLSIVASYGTRVVPRTIALDTGLPTTIVAELPDQDLTVSFDVAAKQGLAILAHASTPDLAVQARHVTSYTLTLSDTPGGDGDGGTGGDGMVVTTSWTAKQGGEPLAAGTVTGLWGASGSDVYATSTLAGATNLLRSTDHGAHWQPQLAGGLVDLHGVHGSSSSEVLLVGNNATILRGAGSSWTAETATAVGSTTKLFGVFAVGNGNEYACGGSNAILKNANKGGWISQNIVGTTEFHSVWGVPGNVWAVGSGGTIRHSAEDNMWPLETSNTGLNLNSVWGTSATDIWAVGDGVVLHSTGNGIWTPQTMNGIPDGTSLSAVTAAPGGTLFVAGTGWSIFRLGSNNIFVQEPTDLTVVDPVADRLFALFAPSTVEAFAGGAGRTLLHRP
jgi:hypothetical protein